MTEPLSLLQLNTHISATLSADKALRDVWVVAETGDVRVSGGHCYLELLEKEENTGRPVARLKAIIWASQYGRIASDFLEATGQRIVSDLKVMVRVTVNFHPAYGMSAIISDINPDYTCGDIMRRRRMMIDRLKAEGIFDMNRTLPWPDHAWRIAVISSRGAAGYGDFINHLYGNPSHYRYQSTLFQAVMQGQDAPSSIILALDCIASNLDDYDCVVIIRGGGATGDLTSFDDYNLAANVAQFPLPIIVGIGHQRDETILDYVAAVKVKTPTAAAEWLISHTDKAYGKVKNIANEIFNSATSRISGGLQQIAYFKGLLPTLVLGKTEQARNAINSSIPDLLTHSVHTIISRQIDRLKLASDLIDALSPETTLRRGFSISRVNGHVVSDLSGLSEGCEVVTQLSSGSFSSIVKFVTK